MRVCLCCEESSSSIQKITKTRDRVGERLLLLFARQNYIAQDELIHMQDRFNMSGLNGYKTRSKLPKKSPKTQNDVTLFEYPHDGNSTKGTITFTQHDLLKLKPPQYLNDTVISFFMQYYLDKNVSQETKSRVHIFNSFFFAKLQAWRTKQTDTYEESFRCISKWLKGIEIFKKDFLIMPVCEKDHWILVIVSYPDRLPSTKSTNVTPNDDLYEPAVFVLNSWNGYGPGVKKSLNRFLKFQWLRERNNPRNFSIRQAGGIRLIFPRLPQQSNNYNCGVFVLNYFYCFMNNPREAYLRMFRKTDMTSWFEENDIHIPTERKRMTDIINTQKTLWSVIERRELSEEYDECNEVYVSSSSQSCDSSVDLIEQSVRESKGSAGDPVLLNC